ncbi:hypothetical protein [Photobacterium arenosum]|nr:hypothetical protein [Photobacterium arenosum]
MLIKRVHTAPEGFARLRQPLAALSDVSGLLALIEDFSAVTQVSEVA